MNKIKFITLTHANMDTKIEVVAGLVSSIYYSPNHHCTMVVSNGGSIVPAKESVEQIKQMMLINEGEESNVKPN